MDTQMRMSGFASGMDIDGQVREIMEAERMPLQDMESDLIEKEMKVDQYREMNTKFSEFDDQLFEGVTRRSNMTPKDVQSTNEDLVSASASADVDDRTMRIEEVRSLASSETVTAAPDFIQNADEDFDPTAALGDYIDFGAMEDGGTNEETLNPDEDGEKSLAYGDIENVSIVGSDGYNLITDGDAEPGADDIVVDTETGAVAFGDNVNEDVTFDYEYNAAAFNVTTFNDDGEAQVETFEADAADSLNDVIEDINNSEAGVTMFYDNFTGEMSVTRDETGARNEDGQEMIFDGALMEEFNLTDIADENRQEATNAEFTVDGIDTERRDNQFEENGVEVSLNNTFSYEDEGPVSLGVNTDTDAMVEEVMSFVDGYNDLVSTVNDRLNEDYNRDYAPLTDDQRGEMTEHEIELWDEQANSGLLRNDDILSSGVNRMRESLYSEIDTGENTDISYLFEIGITTSSDYMERNGELEVDEDQLRSAVEDDPEAVYQLFNSDGGDNGGEGVANQLRDHISATEDQIAERAGNEFTVTNENFRLGQDMERQSEQIANFEERMQRTEERYWDQFSAMEQAMAEAQQMQQQMMSQMGGMMGGQM